MSTRADGIAFRSLLWLFVALAVLLTIRFGDFSFVKRALVKFQRNSEVSIPKAQPAPSATPRQAKAKPTPEKRRETPVRPVRAESEPEQRLALKPTRTPQPTPIPRITRLRVEPKQWSAPLYVPPGESVGISFTLGRLQIEQDGRDAGRLFRNPMVTTEGNTKTIRPLVVLDRTPRIFWFDPGIRVLRFMSLEKEGDDIEVLWR